MTVLIALLFLQHPADLVAQLDADSLDAREAAVTDLRALGDAAVPELEKAASGPLGERRDRARALLHDLGAVSALIEDLRSDEVDGNAKAARLALIKRYNAGIRDALLKAVVSDDDQQAIEAAFVLVVRGDGESALKAAPALAGRAMGAFVRDETDRFSWVAGHVMLRLGALMEREACEKSFTRALRGVDPSRIYTAVRDLHKLSKDLKLAFPRPLLRVYLRNLRDDDAFANAYWCGWVVREIGAQAVPVLLEIVGDTDSQQRHRAADLLMDISPRLHPLVRYEVLQQVLRVGHPTSALRAARELVRIDRDRWPAPAIELALRNLEADTFCRNAWDAASLLVAAGPEAIAPLIHLLDSDDEQAVCGAALALAELGRLPALKRTTFDQVYRCAARPWGQDEPSVMKALLSRSPETWTAVCDRLQRSGVKGQKRAKELDEDFKLAARWWRDQLE